MNGTATTTRHTAISTAIPPFDSSRERTPKKVSNHPIINPHQVWLIGNPQFMRLLLNHYL